MPPVRHEVRHAQTHGDRRIDFERFNGDPFSRLRQDSSRAGLDPVEELDDDGADVGGGKDTNIFRRFSK